MRGFCQSQCRVHILDKTRIIWQNGVNTNIIEPRNWREFEWQQMMKIFFEKLRKSQQISEAWVFWE